MSPNDRYDSLFRFYAQQQGVDWLLMKAQVQEESQFNPFAVNPTSGASGLAQFMLDTFIEWSKKLGLAYANRFDAESSIACQAAYMAHLLNIYVDIGKALAAYNWGMGNLYKLLLEHRDDWKDFLPIETKNYLVRVNLNYDRNYENYFKGVNK